jgi:phosphonate transport system substrate-binding protein
MKRFFGILIQSLVVGSLLGCSLQPTETPVATEPPTPCVGLAITLGDVEDQPTEVISGIQPFANYLAARLAPYGIACGRVRVVDTVDEMVELIKKGEMDIYFDSMYPAYLVSEATGAQPILRQWRNCDPEYHSVIVARADSGIKSIDDLLGHMVAMDNPYSTSGFVLPSSYLIDHGFSLVVKESYSATVAQGEIGIVFSSSDSNSYAWIHTHRVDAAVTDDYTYSNIWETTAPGEVILLAETVPMPRRAVIVRADLPDNLQQAIKDELLQAKSNPEAKAAMDNFVDTCEFDDTPQGIEAAFAQMREMDQKIQAIPGLAEALKP